MRAPVIDKDDARDSLQGLEAASSTETDCELLARLNKLAYDIMFKYVETQLSLGLSVIVDCPFAQRMLFDRACSLAKQV